MRAMILAAGRGERMRKMSELVPKPLLHVAGHYLIEYAIYHLKHAGIHEIVINVSYRGEQIKQALGDGARYGVALHYSEEQERLETGGGILQALPLLGNAPFIVMSSDIITDFPLQAWIQQPPKSLAHLLMIDNPSYHPKGDFGLTGQQITMQAPSMLTFASVGLYDPALFHDYRPGHFRLTEVLLPAIAAGQVTGEHYRGMWYNIGTPEDLETINQRAREDSNLRPLASETNTLSN